MIEKAKYVTMNKMNAPSVASVKGKAGKPRAILHVKSCMTVCHGSRGSRRPKRVLISVYVGNIQPLEVMRSFLNSLSRRGWSHLPPVVGTLHRTPSRTFPTTLHQLNHQQQSRITPWSKPVRLLSYYSWRLWTF
jgi:hypothetical protein